ncbi:metallophosphoesterase [Phenylobacterium sp.]|uniref:metallophosphoesterase family protein n=1 Tax=Phenylobacterium sp. TaxID=1871053 RepID=UPI00286E89B5|nr:metallophosphoesterase [Phenylobacterium sp.]
MRIAHLSDIHFGGENVEAVAAATQCLAADQLDLVVVSGDLTRFGEKGEFASAAAWLKQLPEPRLVTPGNHDAPYLAWYDRVFSPFARYERAIGPARFQTHLAPGLAVYGVNTARGVQPRANWSKGQISDNQVQEALAWFAAAPADTLKIVVCHHPLTEMIGGPMTGKVWNGEAAAKAFAEAGVDLVLSGHIHAPFTWPYGYGDGKTYAAGCGTLSIRERGVPPGYNIVETDGAEIRVTAKAWTGSKYESERTWSLTRR